MFVFLILIAIIIAGKVAAVLRITAGWVLITLWFCMVSMRLLPFLHMTISFFIGLVISLTLMVIAKVNNP